ncbi:MAG: hypothetical protein U0175_26345 [Caldilineaceae bacterium]
MKKLQFIFQEPGYLEAVIIDPKQPISSTPVETSGYHSVWVADLMVDSELPSSTPFAFMSSSFDKTYPLIIWALKLHMAGEWFDVPQAGLKAVPLHEAFSWAYKHFILEDHMPTAQLTATVNSGTLTSQVLQYAAVAA